MTAFSIEGALGEEHYFYPNEKRCQTSISGTTGFVLIKDLSGDVCACKESFHLLQYNNLKKYKSIQGTDAVSC